MSNKHSINAYHNITLMATELEHRNLAIFAQ